MSQRWGVGLAVLLLVVAAAVVVAMLARGPRGAHARRPRRPRTLMVSGLVVLAGAAFAGAWAATVTSGPPAGRPGNGPTAGNGAGNGTGNGTGSGAGNGTGNGTGNSGGSEGSAAPDGDAADEPPAEPNREGSLPAPASPDQLAQISGGRVGVPVREVIAAATGLGSETLAVAAAPTERIDDGQGDQEAADWRAWIQLQESPRVESIVRFMNALPQGHELFHGLRPER